MIPVSVVIHLILLGASEIRQCRTEESASTDLRKTFSDIDYAMLGYDIIKGFPESNSHDHRPPHHALSLQCRKRVCYHSRCILRYFIRILHHTKQP